MIQNVSIIGMGALGLLYADQITSGLQNMDMVQFVMDPERADRHRRDTYTINGETKQFRIVSSAEAHPADLVIVAVKYGSLPEALDTMASSVDAHSIIISVMNGVTSENIIAERYGASRIVHTVAQGMDAMRDGTTLRYTQCGALRIGTADNTLVPLVDEVEDLFIRAKVPYVRESDILYRLWFKYMLNIGINQTCMVFDTNYGVATTPGTESNEKMIGAMREVVKVAAAKGIRLTEADLQQCIEIEKTLDPEGFPSMAQDRKAGRKSEVDMFAGEMIRMADDLGIDVPYNRFFYEKVKEIEAAY